MDQAGKKKNTKELTDTKEKKTTLVESDLVGEELIEQVDGDKSSTATGSIEEPSETDKKDQDFSSETNLHISEDYEVLECIGKGGMGTVFKVRDLTQDKLFAVKVLQKELAADASALKRFEQETESASKLSHPNLVSVYKHGKTASGEPYLVMDYLEGKSLSKVIEEEKLDNNRVLDIFIQICEGLEHAHENNVIHRDIKPTNIILTKNETGKEVAKLVDFGIAKVMNATTRETHDLTQTGEVFGSPHYMSPEQCLGFMLKEQSDIYSLGCSLYESITGDPPFGGSNPIQLVVKHINDDVEGFEKSLRKTKMGKQLESVTLKCVEKEPDNRFQSIKALKSDLEKIKEGKKIPLYDVKNKAKPTLTKRQMLVGFAMTFSLFFALAMSSSWYGYQYTSAIASALLSVIVLASFSALTAVGVDKIKGLLGNKRSAKDWWIMLLSLNGGLAGILLTPNLILSSFSLRDYAPEFVKSLVTACELIDAILVLMVLASLIGILLFRKLKVASFSYIFVRQTVILSLLILVPTIFAPDQASKVISDLGSKTYDSFPNLSKAFYTLDSNLVKKSTNSIESVAQLEYNEGNKKKSYDILDNAIPKFEDINDKVSLLKRKANFFEKDGNYKKAIQTINEAMKIDRQKKSGIFDNYLLTKRAWYYYKSNSPEKALEDLDSYISDHKGDTQEYNKKALIFCSQGKYKKALNLLEKVAKIYDSGKERHFLISLIKEHLGLEKSAVSDYKVILDKNEWVAKYPVNQYKTNYLQTAYALNKLGRKEEANKILDKLEKLGVKKSDIGKGEELEGTGLKPKWD